MPGSLHRQHHMDDCGEVFPDVKKCDDDLRSVNNTGTHSQLSTSSTMSRTFAPTFVYQRRRQHDNNSVPIFTKDEIKPSNGCQSAISSEAPENETSPPVERGTVATVSALDRVDMVLNVCNTNENCSSSKSNLELTSACLKFDTDDAGECSSSGALIDDQKLTDEISARDACVLFLRSQGQLNIARTRKTRASSEKYCLKKCRVCARMESTLHMLVCDNCEDGFHVSCFNPNITVLPVGEWVCGSCLKKKHKILNDKSSNGNSNSIGNESGRNQCWASEGELGSLEFMFRDIEPYMSNARIGDEFQAKVPDWSGPVYEECNLSGDPLVLDPSDYANIQERDCINPLKLSSIGNWLQCRGVIEGVGEGVDGTICSKWRRAPLFEVQTDDWECFRCILWDPAHADCAVPQELDTDEVMKQLKYIEMLRPKLATKRRKMDRSKSSGSQGQ
ncbi:phd and ring finger domain-containing protein 1 [Phtheirospermum japonicum]|uniref:Phd and ring finger domain-containing protein 1 n=1 Tax=Phtheirospermum japonicum TaxID=374723 RepID=A0A830DC92_9LAMI|nr:phd and ring finger domain-containing protein 1 [Phtheirospermum japonicum]